MSFRAALVVAVVIFLITLLVHLPARVLLPWLPAQVRCDAPSGTVWEGRCGQLQGGDFVLNDLNWRLQPLALLRLRVSADIASTDARASGRAHVELSPNGDLAIDALSAQLPLPNALHLFPAGWSGSLQLALDSVRIQAGHLVAIVGRISAEQLHLSNPNADLGSFELQFPVQPAGATMVGQLRDLAGALSVQAQLRLTSSGAYEVRGSLAARDGVDPQLAQVVALLGPADTQGRRMFSLAGTL